MRLVFVQKPASSSIVLATMTEMLQISLIRTFRLIHTTLRNAKLRIRLFAYRKQFRRAWYVNIFI